MLARNVTVGLVSSIGSALLGLAVVPLYLKYLGLEAYGLIGFFATIQALFLILDMGMAPTINREIARCSTNERWAEARVLLHTLAAIYWCVGVFICVVIVVFAPLISAHWLKSDTLSKQAVTHAVMLMGLVVACRWPTGLYQGALNGLQKVALSSTISIAMVALGSLGAVCVLAFVSPTIEAFFLWQAGVGLIYAIVIRHAAWRAVGYKGRVTFDLGSLRTIWRFSASMMALTVAGLVFSQLDKVLLSKLLSLDAFAQYVLAGVVASALTIFIMPVYNAIYPRFTAHEARGEMPESLELYNVSSRLMATVLFPLAMIIAVAGQDLIRLWTGNPMLAEKVAPLARLIAIGTALHGTMYIPHALTLSRGKTFIPLTINLVLLLVMVPVTVFFTSLYGAMGGAISWLLLHSLYVLLGVCLVQRFISKSIGFRWLLSEIGIPFLICGAIGLVAAYAVRSTHLSTYGRLAIVFALASSSIVFTFAASPRMRANVLKSARAGLAI